MSRVYDALRRAAENEKDGRGATIDMPPTVDFVEESFPAEVVVPAPAATRHADRPSSSASLHVPRTPDLPTTEPSAPSPGGPSHPGSEVFDRIAVRYEGKTVIDADISPQSREQY